LTGGRLELIVWAHAAEQIEEAADWWARNRQGSPDALHDELARALELITRQPGVGLPADRPRLKGIRRILLPRVGYFLFYRVRPNQERVEVLAFWHSRRGTPPKI
jgi:plasmid stabilization system protein ParE